MTARPLHVVVMGVAATGKTTVGQALGRSLGAEFIEGDAIHPPANVAKMSAGVPLTDEDRRPWLTTLAAMTADREARGVATVLACSALRRSYRDILRAAVPDGATFFVHLIAAPDMLAARSHARSHFMPASLIESQADTLEGLGSDEAGVTIDVTGPVDAVVADARASIRAAYGG